MRQTKTSLYDRGKKVKAELISLLASVHLNQEGISANTIPQIVNVGENGNFQEFYSVSYV